MVRNNWTLFTKSFFAYNILFKIFILFSIGLFFRFFINNFSTDYDFILEFFIFSFSIFPFNKLLLFNEGSFNMKIIDNNVSLIKSRPRDLIINNDYDIKDRCRRRTQWIFFEQFDTKFISYREFKSQWDTNTKLIDQIKDKYYEKKHEIEHEIIVFKKTLIFFKNRRHGP